MTTNAKLGSSVTFTKGKQYKIKIKGKVRKDSISLFLEQYVGFEMHGDTPVPKVVKEKLDLYIPINPKTPKEKKDYNDTLAFAEAIRKERETSLEYEKEGMLNPSMKKINFITYLDEYRDNYRKKNLRNVKWAVKVFKEFVGKDVLYPRQIDKQMIERFRDYIVSKFNGDSPSTIMDIIRRIFSQATEEGIFIKKPTEGVVCKKSFGIRKEILSIEEVIQISNTPVPEKILPVKKVFLFCVHTGLRYVDVSKLKYKDIKDNQLIMMQAKTNHQVVIDLSETAINIIGDRGDREELIFKELPDKYLCCLRQLKKLCTLAGIDRNITWHSARHTFATLLLQNNANIKTVSCLLGHTTITHTQKYLHVVDGLKRQAVDSLPKLTF